MIRSIRTKAFEGGSRERVTMATTNAERFTPAQLREMADSAEKGNNTQELAAMLRQAADDATTLATLRQIGWHERRRSTASPYDLSARSSR